MNSLIVANIVGWLAPFAYLLVAGYGRLPTLVSAAMLAEIVVHLLTCAWVKGYLSPRAAPGVS